jgi:hypothetical protein
LYGIFRVRPADLVLGTAEPNARVLAPAPARFIGHPKAGLLGEVIDQAWERPE